MDFVGRHVVFAWTGRKCIFLSSGLLCFCTWGTRQMEFMLVIFRTECSLDRRRLVALPCSDRV